MYFYCGLHIITPMVVAFVGEHCKNIKTVKYAVFISCVLLIDLIMIAIVDGGFFCAFKICFARMWCFTLRLFAIELYGCTAGKSKKWARYPRCCGLMKSSSTAASSTSPSTTTSVRFPT